MQRNPRSSVFHTLEWLEALRRTYGYAPSALSTCPPGTELQNAVVFCVVKSWLTGHRLVSLPFSDHCDFLVDTSDDLAVILAALEKELRQKALRYVEFRPIQAVDTSSLGPHSIYTYCLHQVDLRPDIGRVFSNCHKDSTQRKILRAEREGLTYQEGRSAFLLDTFCDLQLLTRRRHLIPPQPKRWFQNLIDCFGDALKIRVAFKNERAVAAILTLRFRNTLLYKYGCSDARLHNLGGMHLLFWRSILEAKQDGLDAFDLGRSEWGNSGLITFKDRWGGKRSVITYLRLLTSAQSKGAFRAAGAGWKDRAAKRLFPHLPDCILRSAGDWMYRHIG